MNCSRLYLIFALGLLLLGNSIAKSKTYNLEILDKSAIDLCGKEDYKKYVVFALDMGNVIKSDSLVGFEVALEYNPDVVRIDEQVLSNGTLSKFFKYINASWTRGEIVMEGLVSLDAFPNPVNGDMPLVAFQGTFIGKCEEDAYFKVKYFYPIDGFKGTIDTIKDITIKGTIADKPDRKLGFIVDKSIREITYDSTISINVGVDLGIMESLDYWQTRITIEEDSLSLIEVVGTESLIIDSVTAEEGNSYLIDLKVLNSDNLNFTVKVNSNKKDSSLVKMKLETVNSTECICATNFPQSSFEINNLKTKDTVVKSTVENVTDLIYSNGVIMSRDKQLNIEVYNYSGLLIDEQICSFNKVYDTKLLKQGIYFIKVTDGNKTKILKIINN